MFWNVVYFNFFFFYFCIPVSLQRWLVLNVIVMARSVVLYAFTFCTAAVVCNLMAGSCKMISKQTAKSPSSSSLSLPLSTVIYIFNLLSLFPHPSFLSTLFQLSLPNFHLTRSLSFSPLFSSVSTSWYLCGKVCLHKQLVVHWFFNFFLVNTALQ